jgi:HD-GYP domain-containing protein (c-di-GMP phosphodiesterase class II)
VDAALQEIEQGAGTVYDADVVAACLRHYRQPVS